jgi:hypothetical protein
MRKLIVWILKIIVAGFLNFGILCVIGKYSSRLLAYGNYVLLVCFVPHYQGFFFLKQQFFLSSWLLMSLMGQLVKLAF